MKLLWKGVLALAVAGGMTFATMMGLFEAVDPLAADALYQSPRPLNGEIVVIGIDEESLNEIGPYHTWGRDVIAEALEILGEDPAKTPAVVGVDTLFTGETDPAQDARLAYAAETLGNVVVAASAVFGEELITEPNGSFYLEPYVVQYFDEPYGQLREVTYQGHINAMYDTDGILRHSILHISLPDGRRIPSFGYQIAELYRAVQGQAPIVPPRTDDRGHFYLPFSALPGDYYDGVSLADLMAGKVPADYYAGKIVLIGPYATGLQDTVRTPIDRARLMYGVEFHANVIQALLDHHYKWEVPDALQGVILFFLCLLAAVLFYHFRLRVATLLWLGLSLGWLGIAMLLFEHGYVLHPLWVPLAISCLYVTSVAAHYVRAALEQRKVRQSFQRYVAPEIVDEILKGGTQSLKLGGTRYDIAVMFVDMRGFTTMSERWPPEDVVAILNQYLSITSTTIIKNGGTLDKFIGDAVMAFWGAPIPQEDFVFHAARTALEITERVKALSVELEHQYGQTFQAGVGLHYGPAVVGNIGAEIRMDYTVIGDTVNTAARLESNAPGGTVYISRAIAEQLKGRIQATSLGTRPLKGKAEGFEILTLDSLLEQR